MVYNDNDGPIYSVLNGKTCAQFCAYQNYYSLCSDTAGACNSGAPGRCSDDEGIDCYDFNGRCCCCNL